MNKVKFFVLISIICLLLMIPTSFAVDCESAIAIDEPADNLTLTSGESDVLASDWYFDSNAEDDTGNGSITNPYKLLSSSRISSNSILHLANGDYTLKGYSSINNVTIIGENPSQTILRSSGTQFSGSSSLILKNLTLINLRIVNCNLNASNTIFKDSQYSSGNGGVIYSTVNNTLINLNNCTFSNNYAKYGGAIYLKTGTTLTITNSLFINNRANLYGGAIACNNSNIYVNDSRFLNSYSINDAGGAVYLYNSANLIAYNLEINNCSSTFGGAITSLKSSLNLNNFTGKNNRAKYDGGAIYAMYRIFHMDNSLLENNSAENAGAIFVYNIADFLISNTRFIENQAVNAAGAFYSVYLQEPYYDSILDSALNNTFSNNNPSENDVLELNLPDLFIGSGNFTLYKTNFSDNDSIPSRYDLRELGQVSSVKNQGNNGNCWAFAALAALESSILKSSGIEFDFSEQNMKNLISLYSSYGWDMDTNYGGLSRMGYGYLVSWLGPIYDSLDGYKEDTVLSPLLNSIMHVQNILFLKRDNYTDNDDIKQAIMKYGGVAARIYYSGSYMKNGKNYYYTGNEDPNHLVVIVGWDDNYSKSNFKSTPPGDGAWIFKNSWGTYQGENGYYYVSYYDKVFAKVSDYDPFVFVLNDTIKYDKNYQYDIPGITDYFLNQSNVVWYKNKFTATDNEYLAAVSTYFNKDTDWQLSVYVNGIKKLTQYGSSTHSYKTIDLNSLIKLNKGDIFEVVFKITVDNEACVPISEFVSLNTEFYSENVSFISYDGNNWKDLYYLPWAYSSHSYASQVACIKAFTVLNPIGTSIELKVDSQYNPAQFTVTVKDQYGNLVKNGKVKLVIDGNTFTENVVNGIVSLSYVFSNLGSKVVSAQFSATGYASSSKSVNVEIFDKINTTLSASKLTTVYGSGDELVATLKDASGNPVSGAEIIIALGDVNTTVVTDSSGKARLDVTTFTPKVYYATIYFNGNYKYNPSVKENVKVYVQKVSTTLTASDISVVYNSGGKLTANLKDANGNAISNAKVYFTVNGVQSTLTTNSKGQAKLSTNGLAIGNYTAQISFKANTYYYASSTSANIIVTDKLDSTLSASKINTVYGSGDELVATLKGSNGKAISGANVVFTLGDINTTVVTDSSGKARLDVSAFTPKVYYATIYFAGDSTHNPAVKDNVKVYVQKVSTVLTSSDVSGAYHEGTRLVATLKDADGNALSNQKVSVTIDGRKWDLTTNSNGIAEFLTDYLDVGSYTAQIAYKASTYYYASSTTANIVITGKMNTTLSAPKLTTVYGSGDELVVTLKDASGKAIGGANIIINLGDVNTTVVTDSSGKARLDVSAFTPKVYYATIYYLGDYTHNPCVKENIKVYVQKVSTVLTSSDVSGAYHDGTRLVATLKDVNGNALSNQKVSVTIDGRKWDLTTNSDGIVRFSTDRLDVGSYTAQITYKASTYYYASSTTANITIT